MVVAVSAGQISRQSHPAGGQNRRAAFQLAQRYRSAPGRVDLAYRPALRHRRRRRGYRAASQVIGCYVYRFDEANNRATIAISDTQRPNGLAFSPDDKWLYVADMSIIDFPSRAAGKFVLTV
jgi:hypothetical protein